MRGYQADKDRLQADDDCHAAGRDAGFEGDVAQAEIDGLDEEADDRHIDPGGGRRRERRPQNRINGKQDCDHDRIAQGEEGQGLGMRNAEFRDAESARPKDKEYDRGG